MPEFARLKHLEGVHPFHIPEKGSYGARKGCLDQICAWEHFGGLNLEEAYEQFRSRPDIHREDFVWMNGSIFRYYYPVLETYLHEATSEDEFDDCEAASLASVLLAHWEKARPHRSPDLHQRLVDLCRYVRSQLDQYASRPKQQRMVDDQWAQLEDALLKAKG